MSRLHVLIVDDEAPARRELTKLIETVRDNVIVHESTGGRGAIEAIRTHKPDIVFLDIQMPEVNGFDVIDEIGTDAMPVTVFVTAFDEFAVQAFERQALDYLLKPVTPERFETAFRRAAHAVEHKDAIALFRGALAGMRAETSPPGRIPIRDGGSVTFVDIDDIVWVEAAGNYARVHTSTASYLTRHSMDAFETKLAGGFVRVHRSVLVRVAAVRKCDLIVRGSYQLTLKNGAKVRTSRHQREKVERALDLI